MLRIRVERTVRRRDGSTKRSDPPRPAVTIRENVASTRRTRIAPRAVSCLKVTLIPETPFVAPDEAGGVPITTTDGASELEPDAPADPPAGVAARTVLPADAVIVGADVITSCSSSLTFHALPYY